MLGGGIRMRDASADVPRLRMARWATCGMAADITGSFAATMLERSTSAWRVNAPIAMVEPRSSMNDNPGIFRRSTTTLGRVMRKFSSGTRLCPPAMILPSPFAAASASTAASRLVGAT
jgi:hypothetical protein